MSPKRERAASFAPIRAALADGVYRAFAGANLTSFVGIWMQRLVFGLAMWDVTHSGAWLGLLALCDFLPAILLAPVGGVLGDRLDQARLIFLCQAVFTLNILVAAAAMLVANLSALALLVFALIGTAATTLSDPARLSIIARIAKVDALSASVAISSISFNVARFAGPVLGGLAYTTVGAAASLGVAALLSAPFLFVLGRLKAPPGEMSAARNWLGDFVAGVDYAARHPAIGRAFLLFGIACLFVRPVYELMPGFVDRLFNEGPEHASGMIAAIGLGALVAALGLSRQMSPEVLGRIVWRGASLSALALIAFALSPWLWLAYVCAAALGFFISTSANGALILSQTQAESRFQSRAASLWAMVVRAGPALGAVAIGGVADEIGFLGPVLFGGALCLAVAWLMRPARA